MCVCVRAQLLLSVAPPVPGACPRVCAPAPLCAMSGAGQPSSGWAADAGAHTKVSPVVVGVGQ